MTTGTVQSCHHKRADDGETEIKRKMEMDNLTVLTTIESIECASTPRHSKCQFVSVIVLSTHDCVCHDTMSVKLFMDIFSHVREVDVDCVNSCVWFM